MRLSSLLFISGSFVAAAPSIFHEYLDTNFFIDEPTPYNTEPSLELNLALDNYNMFADPDLISTSLFSNEIVDEHQLTESDLSSLYFDDGMDWNPVPDVLLDNGMDWELLPESYLSYLLAGAGTDCQVGDVEDMHWYGKTRRDVCRAPPEGQVEGTNDNDEPNELNQPKKAPNDSPIPLGDALALYPFEENDKLCPERAFGPSRIPVCHNPYTGKEGFLPNVGLILLDVLPCTLTHMIVFLLQLLIK
jgi:hypothetical protein